MLSSSLALLPPTTCSLLTPPRILKHLQKIHFLWASATSKTQLLIHARELPTWRRKCTLCGHHNMDHVTSNPPALVSACGMWQMERDSNREASSCTPYFQTNMDLQVQTFFWNQFANKHALVAEEPKQFYCEEVPWLVQVESCVTHMIQWH
jgi:hypothetical protein